MDSIIPNVSVPEGSLGRAKVERFSVDRDDATMSILFYGARYVLPGEYTRLYLDGEVIMSDTRAEKMDHLMPVRAAKGSCLVMGLGLGMVANAMALKPEVTDVTVLENCPDVIALVSGSLHPKVTVIEADALAWEPPPGKKWDVVWHDIWFSDTEEENAQRRKLRMRYRRRWTAYHGAWTLNA